MSYNPHWEKLAADGEFQRLADELEIWRSQFQATLEHWRDTVSEEWDEALQPILEDLARLRPAQMTRDWPVWREHVANLNQDGHLLREDYLRQLGPTPLSCLNGIPLYMERLAQSREHVGAVGSAIFSDLRLFEQWAREHAVASEGYQQLHQWVEDLGLGLLSQNFPSPALARQQLVQLWSGVCQAEELRHSREALKAPTGSDRWNSWILLLELCEHETQDYGPIMDSLEALDADVDELAVRLTDQEVVEEYREASAQLRSILIQGKRLKGWSQILPPILVELDRQAPRDQDAAPTSQVRSLCQRFEAGQLSIEGFHQTLQEFAASLAESRRNSRVQTAQHPSEVQFLEALAKLQSGLEILQSVEREGQASRLEMGCTLIDEGLIQLREVSGESPA